MARSKALPAGKAHVNRRVAVLVKRFPKLSETFIQGEISSLVAHGLDVRVLSIGRPNESVCQPDAEALAERVCYLSSPGLIDAFVFLLLRLLRHPRRLGVLLLRSLKERPDLRTLSALVAACETHAIGHIHAHYISEPALLADFAAQLLGGSFSVSAHAKDIYLTERTVIRRRIRHAAFVATCTAYNADYLEGIAGEDAERVHLVYHGIDSERFAPAAAASTPHLPTVMAIGRFKRKKGFDVLIKSCALLIAEGTELHCEIVGYGDEKPLLQALIRQVGIDDWVSLRDPIDHAELAGRLQHASIFVLPCRIPEDGDRDGIPNALLEAMACGIPVISTNVSGIPEVIEAGANGLLVAPDDFIALASAMRGVLMDADFGSRLGRAARTTVLDRFNWHKNTERLYQNIDSAANTESPPTLTPMVAQQ